MSLVIGLLLVCFFAGVMGVVAGALVMRRAFRQHLKPRLPEQLYDDVPPVSMADLLQNFSRQVAELDARFPIHQQAQASANTEAQVQTRAQTTAQEQVEHSLQQALQRLPQKLQQAIQVELAFQATQQAQRDQALADQQSRWREEQDQLHAQRAAYYEATINRLAQALSAPRGQPEVRALDSRGATHLRPPAFDAPASRTQAVSARPPELLQSPIVRPAPVYATEEPSPELTDTELDALPPDLPTPGRPPLRILPPPKNKPTLRNL